MVGAVFVLVSVAKEAVVRCGGDLSIDLGVANVNAEAPVVVVATDDSQRDEQRDDNVPMVEQLRSEKEPSQPSKYCSFPND